MLTNTAFQKTAAAKVRLSLRNLCPQLTEALSVSRLQITEAPASNGDGNSDTAIYFYVHKKDVYLWADCLCQVAFVCHSIYPHSVIYIISGLELDTPVREYEIPILEILNSKEGKRLKNLLPSLTDF